MKRVLIVEDNKLFALALKNYFNTKGYAVDLFADADQCLSELDGAGRYDCCFADLRSEGGSSGLDVLRSDKLHATVRVLMTAYLEGATLDELRSEGIHFLQKPFGLADIAEITAS